MKGRLGLGLHNTYNFNASKCQQQTFIVSEKRGEVSIYQANIKTLSLSLSEFTLYTQ